MARAGGTAPWLQLRLYVTGNAPNSVLAITNIRTICEEHFRGQYRLEIIDLLETPLASEAENIVVTPTLIRTSKAAPQRIIGNLSDTAKVLLALQQR